MTVFVSSRFSLGCSVMVARIDSRCRLCPCFGVGDVDSGYLTLEMLKRRFDSPQPNLVGCSSVGRAPVKKTVFDTVPAECG